MKKYEYKGKIYCDEDLSCDIDNYGGDLYELFYMLKKQGYVEEYTLYYCLNSETYYDCIEDFVEHECEDLEVE